MSKAILLVDVISLGRNKECYGRTNDRLVINSKNDDNVWLVKNLENQKVFPVKPHQVKEVTHYDTNS